LEIDDDRSRDFRTLGRVLRDTPFWFVIGVVAAIESLMPGLRIRHSGSASFVESELDYLARPIWARKKSCPS
jgi:hypothetical protein